MAQKSVRLEWHGDEIVGAMLQGMRKRVRLAGAFLRDEVVKNISKPVTKIRRNGRTVVVGSSRSRPGQYPRADTTALMKSITWTTTDRGLTVIVSTNLHYGLILEVKMNRSFLMRTMNEKMPVLRRILTQSSGGSEPAIFRHVGR